MIGGQDQSGNWKIDARFNKEALVDRLQRITDYRDRISLSNLDALEFLAKIPKSKKHKKLVYLDPPYFRKAKRLYHDIYRVQNHEELSQALKRKTLQDWVLTYDSAPEIELLYPETTRCNLSLNYSANIAGHGEEFIFFADNLTLPAGFSPGSHLDLRNQAAA